MSLLTRTAALSTLLFSVGVGLGPGGAGAADAQPGNGGQGLTHSPGAQLALDLPPIVNDHRRQTAEMEIGRTTPERGRVRSPQPLRAEDHAAQQLYDEIMREADYALRH